MKKKLPESAIYLIAAALVFTGLAIVYYAFELVSVPHIHEYSESSYIIVGCIAAILGAGLGAVRYRKTRQRPMASPAPGTPAS